MSTPAPEVTSARTYLPLPLSALIGVGVGLVTSLFFESGWEKQWPTTLLALLPLVWTAGLGAVFLPTARQRWGALALGLVLGAFGLGQAALVVPDGNSFRYLNTEGWTLLAALGLAGLLLLSGWEGSKRVNVRTIPPFAIGSVVTFFLASTLGSLFYGLIALACVLLQAIGIDAPARWLLGKVYVLLPLLLGASAFFVTAIRAQPWGLNLTRTLANVLGFLLPVAALIVLLFAAALPFAGLQDSGKLYQGILSSPLYLTLTLAFGALTLAAFSARPVGLPLPIQQLSRVAAYLLPLYPALALYGLSVRVGQYGLTGARLLGLAGAAWLLLSALALALTRLKPAFAGLSRATAGSLAGLAALAFFFSLPTLRPMEWSARSQAARLTRDDLTARQSAEIVEQLAYQSGSLGKTLLARIPDAELSEAARNQRRRSGEMTARRFGEVHFQGRSDLRDIILAQGSLPLSADQLAELRRLTEKDNATFLSSIPAKAFVLALPEGKRALVYSHLWAEGVWADFDAAGRLVKSGTFASLERPYQTREIDWNKSPFGAQTKAETVTLPVVKAGGATLILKEGGETK